MTKGEMITEMAKSTGLTKADSERALNSFLDIAKQQLKQWQAPACRFWDVCCCR